MLIKNTYDANPGYHWVILFKKAGKTNSAYNESVK
jgi:hypothetical protein